MLQLVKPPLSETVHFSLCFISGVFLYAIPLPLMKFIAIQITFCSFTYRYTVKLDISVLLLVIKYYIHMSLLLIKQRCLLFIAHMSCPSRLCGPGNRSKQYTVTSFSCTGIHILAVQVEVAHVQHASVIHQCILTLWYSRVYHRCWSCTCLSQSPSLAMTSQ